MDFALIDTPTRIFLFAAIFGATAIATAWTLTNRSRSESAIQLAAVLGTLATIPAAIAAPIAPEGVFTTLALLSFAGFALAFTAIVLTATRSNPGVVEMTYAQPAPQPVMAMAAASPLPAFEAPSATRVATFESLTSAGIRPNAERDEIASTLIHGASFRPVARIAFLAHQSGDGIAHRLGDDTHIGRGAGATIVLDDTEVSREHSRVKFENGRFVLYDLGGVNGTILLREGRRRKITTPTLLIDQDVLILGRTRLAYFEVDRP